MLFDNMYVGEICEIFGHVYMENFSFIIETSIASVQN